MIGLVWRVCQIWLLVLALVIYIRHGDGYTIAEMWDDPWGILWPHDFRIVSR